MGHGSPDHHSPGDDTMMSRRHLRKNVYRYRMSMDTSTRAENAAARAIPKLGTVTSVRAYRISTIRDGLFTWREQLLVKGVHGSARFNGVCWGYGGDGPRAVHRILTLSGVP